MAFSSREKWMAKLALAVGLLVLVASLVGWGEIVATLATVHLPWVLAGWSIALVGRVMDAYQLRLVLRRLGASIGTRRILLANSLAIMYGTVLPSDSLASAAKLANLFAATRQRSAVLNAFVYNRQIYLLPWLLAAAVAVSIHDPLGQPWLAPLTIGCALLGLGVMVVLYHPATGRHVDAAIRSVASRFLSDRIHAKVDRGLHPMAELRDSSASFHVLVFLLSTLTASIYLIGFLAMARGAGVQAPLSLLIWTRAVIMFLRQLPISFNGLGIREATLVGVLAPFGVPEAAAFGLGLLMFTNVLIMVLVGCGYQLAIAAGWASWSGPAREDLDPVGGSERRASEAFDGTEH
jgi:uncharacterized membrane protein YbhN (UPF0104 family)